MYHLPKGYSLFEGTDHLHLSVSVFKHKFDIENIVQWTLDKIGVAGYNGVIVNHDYLFEYSKKIANLCVYIGIVTYEDPERTRLHPSFSSYLEASK